MPYLATKISSQNRLLCLSLRGRRQLGLRGRDPQRAAGLHQGQTGVTQAPTGLSQLHPVRWPPWDRGPESGVGLMHPMGAARGVATTLGAEASGVPGISEHDPVPVSCSPCWGYRLFDRFRAYLFICLFIFTYLFIYIYLFFWVGFNLLNISRAPRTFLSTKNRPHSPATPWSSGGCLGVRLSGCGGWDCVWDPPHVI